MKYIIIVKIKPEDNNKYVEISQEFDLDFHPNKKDILVIDEMFLKIKKIYCEIYHNSCFLFTELIDNSPDFENKNEEEIESILATECDGIKKYGWKLIDTNIKKIENIPLKKAEKRRFGVDSFKYFFVKTIMRLDQSEEE